MKFTNFILVLLQMNFESPCTGELVTGLPATNHTILGQVNLATFVKVREPGPVMCAERITSVSGLTYLLATIYGVEKVNSDPTLLGNITLGVIGYDDCNRGLTGVGQALKVIAGTSTDLEFVGLKALDEGSLNVAGIIAALTSTGSMAMANLLNLFDLTMISPAATSDELNDRFKYPNFFRMVPPDSFQARVMVDLMVYFNWTYVSVVHAENSYGYGGLKFMRYHTKRKGICIANGFPLGDDFSASDYEDTVRALINAEKSRVVAVFAYSSQMKKLLSAVHRLQADMFTWILSEAAYAGTVSGVEDVTQGTFLVDWYIPTDEDLKEYIETFMISRYPESPFLQDFWRQKAPAICDGSRISSTECQGKALENIEGYWFSSAVALSTEAVYIYARALDMLVRNQCPSALEEPEKIGDCLRTGDFRSYLGKVTLPTSSGVKQFNSEGAMHLDFRLRKVVGIEVRQVGVWRQGLIDWWEGKNGSMTDQESLCAKPCKDGEFYIQGELPCCWDCYRCRENEIVTANLSACETCPQLTWPDSVMFAECLSIQPSYLSWFDIYGMGLLALAGVGLVLVLVIVGVFVKHRDRRVIKGSSLDMVAVILTGLIMMLVDLPLFIAKPTKLVCVCGRVMYSLSCTLVFVPLLVKTNRVYQVFRASEKLRTVSVLAKTHAVYALTVILILIQIALLAVSTILWPIEAVLTMPVSLQKYVELYCDQQQEGLLIPLSYNLLLITVCCVLAFLTRKLPDNFNESWYIFLNVTTTMFVWIAFLPTYYAAFFAYHKAALLGLALILNGMMVMVCLFLPKLYALAFIPDKDIKITNFTSSTFDKGSVTESSVTG